jgi:hypothetical protein
VANQLRQGFRRPVFLFRFIPCIPCERSRQDVLSDSWRKAALLETECHAAIRRPGRGSYRYHVLTL